MVWTARKKVRFLLAFHGSDDGRQSEPAFQVQDDPKSTSWGGRASSMSPQNPKAQLWTALSTTNGRNNPIRQTQAARLHLLELMIVILSSASSRAIAAPIYANRSSALRKQLCARTFTIYGRQRRLHDGQAEAPQSLEDLVTAGYFREIPRDPFTQKQGHVAGLFRRCVQQHRSKRAGHYRCSQRRYGELSPDGTAYASW